MQVLLGNGAGGLKTTPAFLAGPSGAGVNGAAVADFNADGNRDLVVAFGGGASGAAVLLGDGDAHFIEAHGSPVTTAADPAGVVAPDLDDDGRPDIATPNFDVASVTAELNTSTPEAMVSPVSLSFAEQPQNTLGGAQQVTVANDSDNPLRISRARVVGANPFDFLVGPDTCTGATVAGGSSCTLAVYSAPSATGPRAAELQVLDDAPGSPQQVTLTGTGGALPSGPRRRGRTDRCDGRDRSDGSGRAAGHRDPPDRPPLRAHRPHHPAPVRGDPSGPCDLDPPPKEDVTKALERHAPQRRPQHQIGNPAQAAARPSRQRHADTANDEPGGHRHRFDHRPALIPAERAQLHHAVREQGQRQRGHLRCGGLGTDGQHFARRVVDHEARMRGEALRTARVTSAIASFRGRSLARAPRDDDARLR